MGCNCGKKREVWTARTARRRTGRGAEPVEQDPTSPEPTESVDSQE